MNVFNRIIMILAILALLAAVVFLAVYPVQSVQFLRANLDVFDEGIYDTQFHMFLLVAAGVSAFILLILLILELRRPRKKGVRIKTKGSANAVLGVDSVVQSLEYRIDELAGVRKVRPHIVSRGRDVDVTIDLDTSPSVNIPVLTDQIVDLCYDIVEGQLGVKIRRKVNIKVHHEPYPRGTMPPTQPLPKGGDAIATPPTMAAEEKLYAPVDDQLAATPVVTKRPAVTPLAERPVVIEMSAPESIDAVIPDKEPDDLLADLADLADDDLEGQDE